MQIKATTPKDYIEKVAEDKRPAMKKLRTIIRKNLPKGFKEVMQYNMISYVVPHSLYPDGYHCKPEDPLPFLTIGAQKHFVAVYHMGIYADPKLLNWFTKEYAKQVDTKLDMGKSCIRLKNPAKIPFDLIGELASKMTPEQWIKTYEKKIKSK